MSRETLIAEIERLLQQQAADPSSQMSLETLQQVRDFLASEAAANTPESPPQNDFRDRLLRPFEAELDVLREHRDRLAEEVARLEQEQSPTPSEPQPVTPELIDTVRDAIREAIAEQLAANTPPAAWLNADAFQNPELSRVAPLLHPEQRLQHLQRIQSDADSLLLNLDSNLRTVFETLLANLKGYQDSLSQSLENIYNFSQQGEAIVAALVGELAARLDRETQDRDSLAADPSSTLEATATQSDRRELPPVESSDLLTEATPPDTDDDVLPTQPENEVPVAVPIPLDMNLDAELADPFAVFPPFPDSQEESTEETAAIDVEKASVEAIASDTPTDLDAGVEVTAEPLPETTDSEDSLKDESDLEALEDAEEEFEVEDDSSDTETEIEEDFDVEALETEERSQASLVVEDAQEETETEDDFSLEVLETEDAADLVVLEDESDVSPVEEGEEDFDLEALEDESSDTETEEDVDLTAFQDDSEDDDSQDNSDFAVLEEDSEEIAAEEEVDLAALERHAGLAEDSEAATDDVDLTAFQDDSEEADNDFGLAAFEDDSDMVDITEDEADLRDDTDFKVFGMESEETESEDGLDLAAFEDNSDMVEITEDRSDTEDDSDLAVFADDSEDDSDLAAFADEIEEEVETEDDSDLAAFADEVEEEAEAEDDLDLAALEGDSEDEDLDLAEFEDDSEDETESEDDLALVALEDDSEEEVESEDDLDLAALEDDSEDEDLDLAAFEDDSEDETESEDDLDLATLEDNSEDETEAEDDLDLGAFEDDSEDDDLEIEPQEAIATTETPAVESDNRESQDTETSRESVESDDLMAASLLGELPPEEEDVAQLGTQTEATPTPSSPETSASDRPSEALQLEEGVPLVTSAIAASETRKTPWTFSDPPPMSSSSVPDPESLLPNTQSNQDAEDALMANLEAESHSTPATPEEVDAWFDFDDEPMQWSSEQAALDLERELTQSAQQSRTQAQRENRDIDRQLEGWYTSLFGEETDIDTPSSEGEDEEDEDSSSPPPSSRGHPPRQASRTLPRRDTRGVPPPPTLRGETSPRDELTPEEAEIEAELAEFASLMLDSEPEPEPPEAVSPEDAEIEAELAEFASSLSPSTSEDAVPTARDWDLFVDDETPVAEEVRREDISATDAVQSSETDILEDDILDDIFTESREEADLEDDILDEFQETEVVEDDIFEETPQAESLEEDTFTETRETPIVEDVSQDEILEVREIQPVAEDIFEETPQAETLDEDIFTETQEPPIVEDVSQDEILEVRETQPATEDIFEETPQADILESEPSAETLDLSTADATETVEENRLEAASISELPVLEESDTSEENLLTAAEENSVLEETEDREVDAVEEPPVLEEADTSEENLLAATEETEDRDIETVEDIPVLEETEDREIEAVEEPPVLEEADTREDNLLAAAEENPELDRSDTEAEPQLEVTPASSEAATLEETALEEVLGTPVLDLNDSEDSETGADDSDNQLAALAPFLDETPNAPTISTLTEAIALMGGQIAASDEPLEEDETRRLGPDEDNLLPSEQETRRETDFDLDRETRRQLESDLQDLEHPGETNDAILAPPAELPPTEFENPFALRQDLLDPRPPRAAASGQMRVPPPIWLEHGNHRDWYLGLDWGDNGLTAVLSDRNNTNLYRLGWIAEGATQPVFSIPTVARRNRDRRQGWDVGLETLNPNNANGIVLDEFHRLLDLSLPWKDRRGASKPLIRRSLCGDIPLIQFRHFLQTLFLQLKGGRLYDVEGRELDAEADTLESLLPKLGGAIVSETVSASDAYRFNVREAALRAGLVTRPDRLLFCDVTLAAMLAAVPRDPANNPFDERFLTESLPWRFDDRDRGTTLIVIAGDREIALTPVQLGTPSNGSQETTAQLPIRLGCRRVDYGWRDLAEDVLANLLLRDRPHWYDRLDAGSVTRFPESGTPDREARILFQQWIDATPERQDARDLAEHLAAALSHRDRAEFEYEGEWERIERSQFEDRVLRPFFQNFNDELNYFFSEMGLSVAAISRVLLRGRTCGETEALSNWLQQKLPNAAIVAESADEFGVPSRLAQGLAQFPHYRDLAVTDRQQYSDFFLLYELLQGVGDREKITRKEAIALLERRGISTRGLHSRILNLLERPLPPGVIPTPPGDFWLEPHSRNFPFYRKLQIQRLFTPLPDGQTYQVNRLLVHHLRQYLERTTAETRQTLEEPLSVALKV